MLSTHARAAHIRCIGVSHNNKMANVSLFFFRSAGPTAAGAAVQVYYWRVMRPDQGRVQFFASSVPHVSVKIHFRPYLIIIYYNKDKIFTVQNIYNIQYI